MAAMPPCSAHSGRWAISSEARRHRRRVCLRQQRRPRCVGLQFAPLVPGLASRQGLIPPPRAAFHHRQGSFPRRGGESPVSVSQGSSCNSHPASLIPGAGVEPLSDDQIRTSHLRGHPTKSRSEAGTATSPRRLLTELRKEGFRSRSWCVARPACARRTAATTPALRRGLRREPDQRRRGADGSFLLNSHINPATRCWQACSASSPGTAWMCGDVRRCERTCLTQGNVTDHVIEGAYEVLMASSGCRTRAMPCVSSRSTTAGRGLRQIGPGPRSTTDSGRGLPITEAGSRPPSLPATTSAGSWSGVQPSPRGNLVKGGLAGRAPQQAPAASRGPFKGIDQNVRSTGTWLLAVACVSSSLTHRSGSLMPCGMVAVCWWVSHSRQTGARYATKFSLP